MAARIYAAISCGDTATVNELIHPQATLSVPGANPVSGSYHGTAGLLEFTWAAAAIEVPAAAVYAALSDVRRMGEWSPECVGATLADPDAEPMVGTRFTGHNRIGRWRAWTTRCTVTVTDRRVSLSTCRRAAASPRGASTWFRAPDGTRTEVIQSWRDRRGPARRRLSALTSGVRDRASHNRQTMRLTLLRLKEALERV
ncbi:SRPBCC family protein [Micromonospora sp. NPDC047548]|uniref:SRPBCC family protein n=1 Tax=Micromonospora sp. NPDC047548 TaxID=3155624 RepID=UPI0033F04BF3